MESHRDLVKAKLDEIEENLKLIDYKISDYRDYRDCLDAGDAGGALGTLRPLNRLLPQRKGESQ